MNPWLNLIVFEKYYTGFIVLDNTTSWLSLIGHLSFNI